MRKQKIRGHNRKFVEIENWRRNNLQLRFDLLTKYNREYTEIIVHPWCDISIIHSEIPQPKGKTKQLILNGLIDIYYSWKEQLQRLDKPYYLKIWLNESRFSKSQVVCAVGDKIGYYENLFYKPENAKIFSLNTYGKVSNKLKNFTTEHYLDEDHFPNNEIGSPDSYTTQKDYLESKRWFTRLLKKPHRTVKLDEEIYGFSELYSFKIGNLWILEDK